MSDREIARRCAVGHAFVSKLRGESSLSTEDSEPRTYTTKHGTTATMNTEHIGRRDAILHSVGANADHGLRRKNADKRCAVSQPFVGKVREALTHNGYESEPEQPRTYTTKHGTTATMNTEHIGRRAERTTTTTTTTTFYEPDDELEDAA